MARAVASTNRMMIGQHRSGAGRWLPVAAWIIVSVGMLVAGPAMSDVETPNYEVIESHGTIAIRQYDAMIIAEVEIDGRRRNAAGRGFRLLADYIFGNNSVPRDTDGAMPAQTQESAKIAMTAPVRQQSTGQSWRVSFVMPSRYSQATLPIPNDGRVAIKEIAPKRFAVITFSGMSSDRNVQRREQELMAYVASRDWEVTGSPIYAFYDPPWTLPAFRRNEVMIEIMQ